MEGPNGNRSRAMTVFEWTEDLETGIGAIDRDHRGLFALVNDLHDKARHGTEESLDVTLDALVDYVDAHFDREEALMAEAGYDGLADHRIVHQRLAAKVAAYRKAYEAHPDRFDMDDFMGFLASWLADHIRRKDMDYLPAVKGAALDDANWK